MSIPSSITLKEFALRIEKALTVPETLNVWIRAELSDVSVRKGHCYMNLVEKDPDSGTVLASMRGIIWAKDYVRISSEFLRVTGQKFDTGLKVMVRGSANMHPAYGLSVVIKEVNPEYTMGDLLRRRQEILDRLTKEGIIELNRNLVWPEVPLRIAVVSAKNAAGYGDFINQLYNNQARLHFKTRLFQAVMQGTTAAATIISALKTIAAQPKEWDAVVLIRGGGATSDLACFENYELAAEIARFPLPVIVGIGHERDVTVLDYVANLRVKTPTAAASWLISKGESALEKLANLARAIVQAVTSGLSEDEKRLSYLAGQVPNLARQSCERADSHLRSDSIMLASAWSRRQGVESSRLGNILGSIAAARNSIMRHKGAFLDAKDELLKTLSPQATLARGYSITRVGGKAVTAAEQVEKGALLETQLAQGKITSIKQ